MSDDNDKAITLVARYPLYIRLGFGLVILFGMVGNCSGKREASVYVFILTAVVWACTRIVSEAIEAAKILSLAKRHNADIKAKKDADPPGPPAAT